MKIKKNGKVINLTESDLKRIVKRTLNEQSVGKEVVDGLFDKIIQLKDMYDKDRDMAIEWVESSGIQDKMKELLLIWTTPQKMTDEEGNEYMEPSRVDKLRSKYLR
tara:strand:+ start:159 stop:476 length:318 start_codon:yes stop_codon:yes gene_type:complete